MTLATPTRFPHLQIRRVTQNLDYLRIPLNASEREDKQGDVPYWGANGVVDHVNEPLVNRHVVLIGEDGAPFLDPLKPVAFAVNEPIWPNNHIHVLDVLAGNNPQFIAYALNSVDYSLYIKGSTRDKLNQSELSSIEIPVPDASTQQVIADYLDHETAEIDALIGDLETFAGLSRTRIESILESTLQGERFAQIEIRRLSPIRKSGTSVNGESEPATPGVPGVLKTGAVSKGWFDPSENKAVTDPQEVARLTAPVIGDRVLINRANTPALVGSAVYVADSCDDIYLSDKLWSVDFKAINAYVALTLSTRGYKEQISTYSVGASSSMQNLSYEDFLSVRIPVPDERIQREIVARADSLISRGLEVEKEAKAAITLARERRAALITAAVTGQIDVTARTKPAAEQLEDDIAQGLHREN